MSGTVSRVGRVTGNVGTLYAAAHAATISGGGSA